MPLPPPAPPIPPPTGHLNGPCGLGVDSAGRFYVADYYHDAVDVYDPNADYHEPKVIGATVYLGQLKGSDPLDGPCGLAVGGGGELYVNDHHRAVVQIPLSRRYGYRGARHSFLSAGCPAPEGISITSFPLARASLSFADGKALSETLAGSYRASHR